MKEPPVGTKSELIERFGKQLAEVFNHTLDQLTYALSVSEIEVHRNLRNFVATLPIEDKPHLVAQSALESFIHDLMSRFDESDDFKIIGKLKDGTQFDLRDLCPEGLHGITVTVHFTTDLR
jgi:hypothetical protein